MARILVQADDHATVLMDERSITPDHIDDSHAAGQLIERLRWAIGDEGDKRRGRRMTRRSHRIVAPVPAESAVGRTFD